MVTVLVSSCSAIARHHAAFTHKNRTQPAAIGDDPISGDWDVSFFVHDSTTPGTFKLKLDGNNVSGTAYSDHTGDGTVRDGKWVDGKLSFTLDFKKHESIEITGALRDGKLVGEFHTEGFTSKWEAQKKWYLARSSNESEFSRLFLTRA